MFCQRFRVSSTVMFIYYKQLHINVGCPCFAKGSEFLLVMFIYYKQLHINVGCPCFAKGSEFLLVMFIYYKQLHINVGCPCFAKGSEFLPRLAVSAALEADRGAVHPVAPRWEHAQAQQHRLQHGGVRGGVQPPAVLPRHLLPQAPPHGRQLQEASHHSRGRQLHIP